MDKRSRADNLRSVLILNLTAIRAAIVLGLTRTMRRAVLAAVTAGLVSFSSSTWAQALNPCDLDQNGVVNAADVTLAVNMAIGLLPCTANIIGPGVCNVVVVQRVVNAALPNGTCGVVILNWVASTSADVIGYNVYRATTPGAYTTPLNSLPISAITYTDSTVQAGQTYYYVVRAQNGSGESANSNEAQAIVPSSP
jgi:hypothetical protein